MKISSQNLNFNFKRAIPKEQVGDFCDTVKSAKDLAGQTGKSIFIVHDACLPQSKSTNTGLGNVATKDAKEFFEYMKPYLGFNTVEFLPGGEVSSHGKFYCAYAGSALSLGNHQINPELLTTELFNKILKPEEFEEIVNANNSTDREIIANYKNVIEDGSAQDKALRKAYERFKNLAEDIEIKKDFSAYVKKNNDWLEPKGIFKILAKIHGGNFKNWEEEIDKNLYEPDFDLNARTKRIKQLIGENSDEINFFKFKQFIADSHLAIGRKNLNKIGATLKGDCQIGFSYDEEWAYPRAFKKGHFIGNKDWDLPSLDYDKLSDPKSDASKLLKRKVQLNARRYDSIRFDVGWAYVNPKIFRPDGTSYNQYLGDTVLELIENSVKEIRGNDFDLKNLIYEFEGGEIFKQNSDQLLDPVKKRVKVFGSTFMHEYPHDMWGSNDAFLKRGWLPDEFIIGVGNHDPQPLRQIANNVCDIAMEEGNQYHKANAIKPLARILKLDENSLQNPIEFAKAKWAEPMMAKNNQMFYMDVFGREERFDMQCHNITMHPEKNYAHKIPANYQEAYHKAVQEGYGFNIMDSLEKVFKAKGFDQSHPELYQKIIKYRDILNEKDLEEVIKTTEEKISKNKYLKPILITTGAAAVVLVGIYSIVKGKNKKATSEINSQTTEPIIKKVNENNPAAPLQINNDTFKTFKITV